MRLDELICEKAPQNNDGAINNIVNSADPLYVPLPQPSTLKGKKKKIPSTDRAQNSLIQTLWFYNNSDAS